jgi:hypothetical protein
MSTSAPVPLAGQSRHTASFIPALPFLTLQLRQLKLFTRKDHVNTLSPINGKEEMWAMLHNLGQVIV